MFCSYILPNNSFNWVPFKDEPSLFEPQELSLFEIRISTSVVFTSRIATHASSDALSKTAWQLPLQLILKKIQETTCDRLKLRHPQCICKFHVVPLSFSSSALGDAPPQFHWTAAAVRLLHGHLHYGPGDGRRVWRPAGSSVRTCNDVFFSSYYGSFKAS